MLESNQDIVLRDIVLSDVQGLGEMLLQPTSDLAIYQMLIELNRRSADATHDFYRTT
jgi:hypothetical protein